jgi:hypothetical protein
MNNYEYFQDESDIDSAYNSSPLDDLNTIPDCDPEIKEPTLPAIEQSTISNLWSFLGLSTISKKKQGCLFDCSIHGARCLERCPSNSKKCNYNCLKHGLNCSKECIISHTANTANTANTTNTNDSDNMNDSVTTSVITNINHNHNNHSHHSNNVNNVNNVNNNVNFPSGNKTYFDNYAPFDSKLWPGYNQTGWDLDKLDTYNTDEFIEVLIPNQYPAKTPNPNLLF